MKVTYTGNESKLRHGGRSGGNYVFPRGSPIDVENPDDVKFFRMKAKNNPETWQTDEQRPKRETPKPSPAPSGKKEAR